MNEAQARSALQAAMAWPAWLAGFIVLLAFCLGIATDAIGASHRINILAPPLLLLMLWNVAVYLYLGINAVQGYVPASKRNGASTRRSLSLARGTTVMHCAAAAMAAGALASMYWRGLVFDYQAGWQSTFLSAPTVHHILSGLLGPASWLSGLALPDEQALAQLRFPVGKGENVGENAARWIHWYALTVLMVVILPRSLLAGWSALRVKQLAKRLAQPMSLDRQPRPVQVMTVRLLPFNYQLDADLQAGLQALLRRGLGAETTTMTLLAAADVVAVIFPLIATPELETHGEFLLATQQQCLGQQPPVRLLVLVDESGFKQRFQGGTLATRQAQRRQAWLALCPQAQFVDLRHPEQTAASFGFVTP